MSVAIFTSLSSIFRRCVAAGLLVCLAGVGAHAQVPKDAAAQPAAPGVERVRSVEGIDEYRLRNGLQVLLIPDDSKPTTTVNLTYRVGSRHESYGETGMAHLLEHLLFKGSPKHPQVWNEFTRRGLRANGTTWVDRTNYHASFAYNEDNLRWYIGWLADAMVNSYIARKDLDTEMTVVRNEMENGENDPGRMLFTKTLATMYEWHNYGKSTIGARSDVENVDIARLQAFYRKHYQPDNATLIVSGKFEPPRVLRWIGETFGALKAPARKLERQYTLDPVQDGERSVTLRRSGGVPMLMAAYHVPPGAHPDFAAVAMIDQIMGDVPSGRLHRRLTEKQLAAGAFAFAEGLAEPGFAMFGAQLAPGQDIDAARAALIGTLESVKSEPITADELERARTKWLKDWEQVFSNPERVGVALSESIAQGDWRLYFLQRDRVRDVALADVQRVAEQRLVASNRTLGSYLPTESPQRAPQPARVDVAQQLADFKPRAAAAQVESFEATPANIDSRTRRAESAGVQMALLPKGTRGGVVHAVLTLHLGDVKSLAGQGEVADALAWMLDKGTNSLSRQQIQDRLDQLKTELRISGSSGRVTVMLNSRRETVAEAIALVGEVLRRPQLAPEALDEYKRLVLSAVEQQRKEPEAVADNALARLGDPYPRGDPRYARSFDEVVEDTKALTPQLLRDFHERFYGIAQAEFAAVGDFDDTALRAALEQALSGWTAKLRYERIPNPLVPREPQRLVLNTPDKQNATLLVQLALPVSDRHADYPALMMANHLLGSGGSSRLWKRIRENEGLSYDVRSGIAWSQREENSMWQGSAIFAPQNRDKVEASFKQEVARALEQGFTEAELADGKRGLLNFRRLGRAQDRSVAFALAGNLELGRTFAVSAAVDEALSKLTLADVNAALRKYIRPDRFVWAFAGDFKP